MMKRISIVALVALCAQSAWADEGAPPEVPVMTGATAPLSIIVNQAGKAAWEMEQDENAALQASRYADQLEKFEAQVDEGAKKLAQLDKDLRQQENDLKANYEAKRAGKSDADQAKLKAMYEERRKELANARKLANKLPGQVKRVKGHIDAQEKVLRGVKAKVDWVDELGRGKARATFHKQRKKMNDLVADIATNATAIKAAIDKGSELDFKGEKAGKFEVTVKNVQDAKPEWEWTINGQKLEKGSVFYVGDDRTIKLQVKLVEDRRKQSRTLKSTSNITAKVSQKDYDYEYESANASAHWTIKEETYSDWRVEAKTPRVPMTTASDSGVFATVKGDVMTIEFSPDTASEQLHISVIGRLEWQMEGKRNGSPVLDKAEASGNWSIDLNINPAK